MRGFMNELQTVVPPVSGTASYQAADMKEKYFPETRFENAVLVKSKNDQPLLEFMEGSTCELQNKTAFGPEGLELDLSCTNTSALGDGCIRTGDLLIELDAVVHNLVAMGEKMGLMNSSVAAEIITAFETLVVPALEKTFPNITECPENPPTDSIVEDWMTLAADVNRTLATQFPQCVHNVVSFASLPSKTVRQTFPISSPSLGKVNATVQITLPAGTFWSLLENQMLTEDGRTMLIDAVTTSCDGKPVVPESQEDKDVANAVKKAAEEAPASLAAKVSSQTLMLDGINKGIKQTMDLSTLTMPVALLILAYMVGNLRLLICTLLNLAACLTVSILIMNPIAKKLTVSTTSPSMMMAVALGMSIDYSLFLLTRFQKEVSNGRSAVKAVTIMLGTSGKIVLVSGLTLLLCFLMMLVLPASFIANMGVAASITVLCAILAALTLSPVMLLTFPNFFGSNRRWGLSGDGCCCCCCRQRARSLSGPMEGVGQPLQSHQSAEQDHDEALDARMEKSYWPTFGGGVQRWSIPILIAFVAIAIPVAVTSLPRMSYSCGMIPFMPTDAPATKTILELQDAFGVGALFPTSLIVVPPHEKVDTDDHRQQWLSDACEALRNVAKDVNEPGSDHPFEASAFSGVMMINGKCTSMGLGSWSKVGGDYSATEVMISYSVDPFSTEGQNWITRMRNALAKQTSVGSWYLAGEGPNQMDAANETFKAFPLMISLMMVVVLILIGISFRSVIAPIRAVVCLSWMLVVTFGLAIYVFQDGCFDFLSWTQLGARSTGAMSWMSPCLACPIVVGLGLDYDIFYSESILEERQRGHPEKEAVVRALTDTANTISAAGLIMVLAFLALLLCTTPTLNEISFLLIVGILIDCIITTKLIIPAAMYWLGSCNFWPQKFPERCIDRTSSGPRHFVEVA